MTTKYSKRIKQAAFSLVEVVIALGVVTFACVSLLALLANGLVTVNHAIGNTVNADIVQTVINSAQVNAYTNGFTTNLYFNNEGAGVTNGDPTLVYGASVIAIPLTNSTEITPNTAYSYNTNSASTLEITVTNRAAPGVSSAFSLIWANSGK